MVGSREPVTARQRRQGHGGKTGGSRFAGVHSGPFTVTVKTEPHPPAPLRSRPVIWAGVRHWVRRGEGEGGDKWCSCPQCSTDEGKKRNICFDFEGANAPHPRPLSRRDALRLRSRDGRGSASLERGSRRDSRRVIVAGATEANKPECTM